jgi:hypothetical protein
MRVKMWTPVFKACSNETRLGTVLDEGRHLIETPADGSPLQRIPWGVAGNTTALTSSVCVDGIHLTEINGIHFPKAWFATLHTSLVLAFVYCRYKPSVPKLITLWIPHLHHVAEWFKYKLYFNEIHISCYVTIVLSRWTFSFLFFFTLETQ